MFTDKRILAINLFLILAVLAAYSQVGNYGFVNYDDNTYITENDHIQNGITLQGLRWAFTTGHAANWHPVTWISHMLDIQLFGLNPGLHHLMNLLFHIANMLLLFFVLHRMTKAPWQSAFVAALFALHPLHVESVAWISERKDVLSTFFWMLTLVGYGYYARRPCLKTYMAVLAFSALGLMAKPMLVTMPFVLLLLDYWPLDRFGGSRFKHGDSNQRAGKPVQQIRREANRPAAAHRKKVKAGKPSPGITAEMEKPANKELQWASIRPLVLEKIPFLALSILSCVATYIAQSEGGAVASIEVYTPFMRIANAFVSYVIYFAETILPDNLSVFYPYPELRPSWQVLGAVLFLVAVTFAVIRTARRSPYLLVGWLWFTGTLVPVIGIVQVGDQAMADRYTYVPSIGLFIMAAWGFPELLKRRRYGKEVLVACSALCLLCFLLLTRAQAGYWRDSITLFEHALNVTKNNYCMYYNRGHTLESLGKYSRAIEDFDRAIEINPRYADAYNNRGIVYNNLGNYTRAIQDFDRAVEFNPKNAPAYNNRGAAYMAIGNPNQALKDYNVAIDIDPSYADAYYNRGILYNSFGKYQQAIDDYDKAVKTNKFNKAEVFSNRGAAYGYLGDQKKAIEDYGKAIDLDPEHAKAYFNRGVAYEELGDWSRAVSDYGKVIELNPESAKAYYNRGKTYEVLGKASQATEDIKAAAKLGYEEARNYLKEHGIEP